MLETMRFNATHMAKMALKVPNVSERSELEHCSGPTQSSNSHQCAVSTLMASHSRKAGVIKLYCSFSVVERRSFWTQWFGRIHGICL